MYYDYHVHSHFSSDCDSQMKDVIESAIEFKLKEVCITDHIDYDYCDPSINFEIDLNQYSSHIQLMRDRYGDRIKILKGIEMGIQPHIVDKCDRIIEKGDFDFVISSMHTCNRQDLYNRDFFKGKSPREAYLKYFEEMLFCIKNFKNFSVLGHLNILARYDDGVAKENLTDYFDVLEVIFKELIIRDKGIEINTSSLRYKDTLLLSPAVLKFYHSLGGEIITLGSDTHAPNTLAHGFDYIYDILKDIGFKYIAAFEKMEPRFVRI